MACDSCPARSRPRPGQRASSTITDLPARPPERHWAAGSSAHSVGQGLTVTVRPWSVTHSPRPRGRAPTLANCDACAYLRPAFSKCVTGLRGRGAHCVGQGLIVTAAPTSGPWLTLSSPGRGVGRPQCRPLARANSDGCAHPRPAHPHTHTASAPRRLWTGGSGGLPDGSRPAPRRPGHVRLERSGVLISPPTRHRLGRLSRIATVSDPRF